MQRHPSLWILLCILLPPSALPADAPVLRLDPAMHTAMIRRIATDATGSFLVTASEDKTARVWDTRNGELLQVLRPPIGPGNEGKLYAVALSPDGALVAVGGYSGPGSNEINIYLFERRSGELRQRISGLPSAINHLAFAPDGRHLAAALGAGNGIRVYARENLTGLQDLEGLPFRETARDSDYGDDSYWVEFNPQAGHSAWLVSTALDGQVRLYGADGQRLHQTRLPGGERPYAARFSPDGKRIAVGFDDSTALHVLSAEDLRVLNSPDTAGINNGDLSKIAWAADGSALFAGGRYQQGGWSPVLRWADGGHGARQAWPASRDTVMDLRALPDGGLLFGAADPAWGRFDAQGHKTLPGASPVADFRAMYDKFLLSVDGDTVQFGYESGGKSPARFSPHRLEITSENLSPPVSNPIRAVQTRLSGLGFNPGPIDGVIGPKTRAALRAFQRREGLARSGEADAATLRALDINVLQAPRTDGLEITDWNNSTEPRLNGQPLPLENYETAFSYAIAPDGQSFVLGTAWRLRYFDKTGQQRWQQAVPGTVWGVNIAANGQLAVAAYGDGTLRWHRLSDGVELLAFYPHPDKKRWVLWTPEGFFAHAPGSEDLIGYHLNRGPDQAGEFVGVDQLYHLFYRPDLVQAKFHGEEDKIHTALAAIGDVETVLAGGLPPALTLRGGAEVRLNRRDHVLELETVDQGGGIGRIEVKINGKTLAPGSARPFLGGYKLPVSLLDGDNSVEVTAYNAKNQIAARPIRQTLRVDVPKQPDPELHLLAVGVNRYRDHRFQLKYAKADAEAVFETLSRQGKRLFPKVHRQLLTDEDATHARIAAALDEAAKNTRPQDVFVLYLSGHGLTDNGRYFFIPRDLIYRNQKALEQDSLNQEFLQTKLTEIPAQKTVLILDTCYSGQTVLATRGMETVTALNKLMRATGSAVLASAGSNEMALEGHEGHGVFTFALLQGLHGLADSNGDKQIRITELADYVGETVPAITRRKWNYEQFPMHELRGHSFPLVVVE